MCLVPLVSINHQLSCNLAILGRHTSRLVHALLCLIIGGRQIAFFEIFIPRAFYHDPPNLRNFRESPTPFLITTPHFMKLLGKTFKCKMKIMGENQMRKLQWTQTIIILLLIQTEQIPTSEQNNQWICKLKKSLNQRP